jgi:GT2 family glycosyltransferase
MLTWRENLSTLVGHGQPDGPAWRVTRDVDYVAGCTLLARADLLRRVGLFDAGFFAYMEDIDLCLRARDAGAKVRVVGEVAALHAASSTTGGGYNARRKYMMGVNSVWFLRRHARAWQWVRFALFDVLPLPILCLFGLFRGRAKPVLAKAAGILDGLRGRRVTAEAIQEGAGWLW